MIKVKSLEIREIEYSYDKRPKINGIFHDPNKGRNIRTRIMEAGAIAAAIIGRTSLW